MLDYDEAVRLAHEVVAEYGEDYVYQRPNGGMCVYVTRTGKPSCLVGQILHRAGWKFAELNRHCGVAALPQIGSRVSPRALQFLAWVQYEQDRGTPWGLAIEVAKDEPAGRILPMAQEAARAARAAQVLMIHLDYEASKNDEPVALLVGAH